MKVVAGFALLVAGLAMLALPGPGWLAIAAGLGLLADEFPWARRLLTKLKETVGRIRQRFTRRRSANERPGSR